MKFPLQLPLSGMFCTPLHSSKDHSGTAMQSQGKHGLASKLPRVLEDAIRTIRDLQGSTLASRAAQGVTASHMPRTAVTHFSSLLVNPLLQKPSNSLKFLQSRCRKRVLNRAASFQHTPWQQCHFQRGGERRYFQSASKGPKFLAE